MLLQVQNETGELEYTGEMVDLLEAISRLPTGTTLLQSTQDDSFSLTHHLQ